MTEYEIKNGLSQDAPGPLEPVELTASPVSTVEQEQPAAYLTLDEEGSPCMLFFDVVEARTYCEVGEEPVPLYRRSAPAAGDAQIDRDAAFEAVRKRLCAIPRYSFYLDDDGVVRRVEGRSGNWIEFDAAHELFDPVAVDAAIAAQRQGDA